MKLIGYRLVGQDNGSVMFKDTESRPLCPVSTALLLPDERTDLYDYVLQDSSEPKTCPTCGWRLNFQAHNSNYVLRSTKRDISETYDGQTIVTNRFREYCLKEKYSGIQFLPFLNDENHFHLVVDKIIKFDQVNGRTWAGSICISCGNYDFVGVSKPYRLIAQESISDDFYRTDLCFAHGNEKHPLIIVGIDTKDKLKAAGLKGLEFSPAYGIE